VTGHEFRHNPVKVARSPDYFDNVVKKFEVLKHLGETGFRLFEAMSIFQKLTISNTFSEVFKGARYHADYYSTPSSPVIEHYFA